MRDVKGEDAAGKDIGKVAESVAPPSRSTYCTRTETTTKVGVVGTHPLNSCHNRAQEPERATARMAGRREEGERERGQGGTWSTKIAEDSYYEAGTTRTKANSTLFVAFRDFKPPVAAGDRASTAEGIFSAVPGYIGVRQVRAMCFVDFEDIKSATAAMIKFQGHRGLTIDYDKDTGVATKRKREREEANESGQREAQSCAYYCARCGTKALHTGGTLLSAMPARGTDGARVVDEANGVLKSMLLEPVAGAQPALVKREKGTERQYRLGCRSCSAEVAYRSTPDVTPGKYLYVHGSALRERPLTQLEQAAASAAAARSGSLAASSAGERGGDKGVQKSN